MLVVKKAAEFLSISPMRLKQILKENQTLKFKRENNNNGIIKLPPMTMFKLLKLRNKEVINKKVVIKSQKGGVGGSTLTVQTAIRIAESRGVKVLIIDADPEASSTSFLLPENINLSKCKSLLEVFKHDIPLKNCILKTKFEGVSILPAKGIMRRVDRLVISENPKNLINKKLKTIKDMNFSTIFLDIPPTYSRIAESCYLAADLVILPTDPSAWGLEGVMLTHEDIISSCNEFELKNKPEIKILMNKYNPSRIATKEAWESMLQNFKEMVLPITVRESADIQNATNLGLSIFQTKCSQEVRVSIDELCNILAPIEESKKKILQ